MAEELTPDAALLPSSVGEVYLVLRYQENGINPIPGLGPPGEGTAEGLPSRLQESFEIGYDPPGANHPPAAPPNAAPPIRLARRRRVRGRWQVDARFRRLTAR